MTLRPVPLCLIVGIAASVWGGAIPEGNERGGKLIFPKNEKVGLWVWGGSLSPLTNSTSAKVFWHWLSTSQNQNQNQNQMQSLQPVSHLLIEHESFGLDANESQFRAFALKAQGEYGARHGSFLSTN
jgi:hypothetical protein